MATQGSTTIDFGAFPGNTNVALNVTGQTGIASGAEVDAWLTAAATADHSIDEHVMDGPIVLAGNVQAGVGFTIYAAARDLGGKAYGLWSVSWVWNN
jgi:hypothetical protein